ncbi:SoxR reducing system RseC family protein [Imhoffiella purpurea]|uniref:Sigma factor RpoE regulatory protein RseC n=1 Tax=Imhoffiella purpurea TaxID=1249627 RepID=W9VCJ9_9GAMM|nr:SoxR reducing system RseC family protein [Imhoffiella purpurea]EXJ14711.1 Sigma factor RpoE regulatory protein RseC [Imhoffiella purpurea]
MIEQEGTVIAVIGRYARVRTERRGACGRCSVSNACGTSLLERFFGRRPGELTLLNLPDADVGDRVLVGISEQGLLRAAVLAYLVPVLALIGGAMLGETWGGEYPGVASLVGGALGLTLALLWLRGYSVLSVRHPERQSLVLKRLEPLSIAIAPPVNPRDARDPI